jgi:hypothetical protein
MRQSEFWLWVIFLLFLLVVVVMMLWLRHRNQQALHQERMSALEKGVPLPATLGPFPWSARVYLLRGLIWSFTGAALILGLLGLSWSSHRPHQPPNAEWQAMQARSVSRNLDIPIEQAREIVAKDEAARTTQFDGPPASIALFGLIPLAVGLAYLVFYRTTESREGA